MSMIRQIPVAAGGAYVYATRLREAGDSLAPDIDPPWGATGDVVDVGGETLNIAWSPSAERICDTADVHAVAHALGLNTLSGARFGGVEGIE